MLGAGYDLLDGAHIDEPGSPKSLMSPVLQVVATQSIVHLQANTGPYGSAGMRPARRPARERLSTTLGPSDHYIGMAHVARESIPITPPHVLIQADTQAIDPIAVSAPRAAWRMLGRFGVLLAVIGGIDIVLHWYPPAFKSPEWEFGTAATTLGALPLPTMGLVAVLASGLARAVRANLVAMAVIFSILTLFVFSALLVFMLDVPLALNAVSAANVPPQAATELKRTIARTVVMGLGFGSLYLYGAIVSIRFLLRRVKDA